jgi:hypothetical protein
MDTPSYGQLYIPLERGAVLIWKKLQKTLKKNHTSLNKNHTKPHFNAACTIRVWFP